MSGRDQFKRYKNLILLISFIFKLLPKFVVVFIWDLTTNFKQIPFIALRYIIAKRLANKCGDNVLINTNVQILGWEKLNLGNNVSIHANCYIDATGGIQIMDNVSIAHNSTILSTNHDWKDKSLPIKYNPVISKSVFIDNDVWVGCACRILAGVTVNSRSIVAAGAVVNKDVEPNTIVGGIPAKKIKDI